MKGSHPSDDRRSEVIILIAADGGAAYMYSTVQFRWSWEDSRKNATGPQHSVLQLPVRSDDA